MLISTESYNRHLLTPEEKSFFMKIVPLSYIVNEWTYVKAGFLGIASKSGILPSIILADILLRSHKGNHPISKTDCAGKYSNNLSLLEVNNRWTGKVNIYEGIAYKAYKNYREFAEDYSDHLTFSREYDDVLRASSFIDQAAHLGLVDNLSSCYSREIVSTINELGLEELDRKIAR